MTEHETPANPWPAMFESVAEQYDQSGVPWFRPIAGTLVDLLQPQPGERFLELGPGRGAATVALAQAVGPDGLVDAIDIAPSMVRLLQEELDRSGVTNVRPTTGDAADPRPAGAAYDGIVSSLVLFFLPDPVAALKHWRALVRPGGRVGISTFPLPTGRLAELLRMVVEFAGEAPSPRGGSPFDSDDGVEGLFRQAGYVDARTTTVTHAVPFEDATQWRAWSLGTVLRRVWIDTDPARHPEILKRAEEILSSGRDDQGRMTIEVDIRYTVATV
jgi:ubiquinone/menaquinone biosynthesis C-methylase UbiE